MERDFMTIRKNIIVLSLLLAGFAANAQMPERT